MQSNVIKKEVFSIIANGTALLCLFLFFSSANAEESKGKVAVLDLERAVMMTDVAREKVKTLESQKDYAEMKDKIESLQKDAEKKVADAQKESPTWTPEQQANYRKDMDFMQKDMQLADQKMRAQYGDMVNGIMKDMEPKIKEAVDGIIAQDKITILIRREAVFMAVPDADITAEVTAKLNNKAK